MALSTLAVAAGLAFVFVVPPGLPYDEGAHWINVLYYQTHHAMPVVGRPGTSYESQQGPLAYVLFAVVDAIVRPLLGARDGFEAVRMLGGVELLCAATLAWRLVRRFVPETSSAVLAISCMLLAPMFLAMGWSVQNDALALVLVFGALEFAFVQFGPQATIASGLGLGVLLGLGLLTKITVWPLIVCVPLWVALRHGRRSAPSLLATGVAFLAVAGWWLVRNHHLYGSLLPSSKLPGQYDFAPYGFSGLHAVGHMVENVITYLWLPTEYYRNELRGPSALKGVLALATATVIAMALLAAWRRRPSSGKALLRNATEPLGLVVLTGGVALVGWAVIFTEITAAAPRIAYADLPLWLVLIGRSASVVTGKRAWLVVVMGIACLVGLDVWTLTNVGSLPAQPFEIKFR